MTQVILEIDTPLYRLLKSAADEHHVSLEEECRRRLQGNEQCSAYLQALLAELRAADKQRRAGSR